MAIIAPPTKRDDTPVSLRNPRQIRWKPLMQSWIKLNADGAIKDDIGRATTRDVLLDEEGRWDSRLQQKLRVLFSISSTGLGDA
ncbi:hypothetical protein J1N35_012105 [Gossypium stocksii]|uniref:Uncharacterized protein n=1 Tax=Gossypium stocksii TaxID=47602 RepID=A0A9D3W3Z5_9ROSI|nr:hypothetical protein J1N35_012105 [Gossypium stocksii]